MRITRRSFLQIGAGCVALGARGAAGQESPKTGQGKGKRLRQSLCWGCFCRKGSDPEAFIREAAAIGYASIEMSPHDRWDAIRNAGMTIAVTSGHGTLKDGLNRKENHDRIEKELLRNIDTAAQNGIPGLICFSGNRNGMADEEGIANTAEGLRRVAKAAEEKKVTLCMELLNSKVSHPDYQCDHTAWGVEVCKRVGSPAVKLLYDIYHMQIMEGNLIQTIKTNIQWIGHFHTAGVPGRRDLDDKQEINYANVMRAIAETGYQGYVGHEFSPKGDPLEAMRRTFALCDV